MIHWYCKATYNKTKTFFSSKVTYIYIYIFNQLLKTEDNFLFKIYIRFLINYLNIYQNGFNMNYISILKMKQNIKTKIK